MQTELAREQMVQQQVRALDVLDERVLATLRNVPRELFVPAGVRYLAFADTEIPLPHGQHMLRPSLVGRILQALELTGTERVLEVGTGTGYMTACLAVNAASVRSVELYPDLADLARANLRAAGIRNAEVITADAASDEVASPAARAAGSPFGGLYEVVVLTCAMPLPDERFRTLLTRGGRMFVIVGEPPVQEARLLKRVGDNEWQREVLFETCIDPLINARRASAFRF
ncbi:MAG TPA: protein-L-isoaspartate O-methyltransferase [Steroidobacteraceae bacterium]|nr:protein-L-isoaspartate O-methyltransferase [Steroidobacteraceae bacterium]